MNICLASSYQSPTVMTKLYSKLSLAIIIICATFSSPLFSQSYKHYDDHHDEKHHKPESHSGDVTESETDESDLAEQLDSFGFNQISRDSLSHIKAIIISADVDGPTGKHTKDFLE